MGYGHQKTEKVLKCSKNNAAQVKRFLGDRWQYDDWVWRRNPRKAQLFSQARKWNTWLYKRYYNWALTQFVKLMLLNTESDMIVLCFYQCFTVSQFLTRIWQNLDCDNVYKVLLINFSLFRSFLHFLVKMDFHSLWSLSGGFQEASVRQRTTQ